MNIRIVNIRLLLISILFIGSFISSYSQYKFNYNNDFQQILKRTKNVKDSLYYENLLKRFNKNDTTLTDYEVLALLIGFTDKKEYKPYQDIEVEREIYKLNGANKYKSALEKGTNFIGNHPLSIKALIELSYAHYKMNNLDSAEYYVHKGQKIFQAMYFSGDGLSPENPTFALGPADGQDFIYKFAGATIGTMGSGKDKNGNFLDILEAKFDNGNKANFYFIIEHAVKKMFSLEEIETMKKTKASKKDKN